jgi:hypothetical protein
MAKRERKIEEGARPFDKVTATLDEGAACRGRQWMETPARNPRPL